MRLELTKRGDYAVRAMIALARHAPNGWLSVRRISDAMAIPVRFLPQVMGDLHRAGLVEAAAGRSGGYRLARGADGITLLDVIEAVEGDSRRRTCVLRSAPCGLDGYCDVHGVFFEAQEALLRTLGAASLAALRDRPDGADGLVAPGQHRDGREREVRSERRTGEDAAHDGDAVVAGR